MKTVLTFIFICFVMFILAAISLSLNTPTFPWGIFVSMIIATYFITIIVKILRNKTLARKQKLDKLFGNSF